MIRLPALNRRSLLIALPLVAALVLGLGATPAQADMSKKVIAAFKGKILVTRSPLEGGADDKATIGRFKKETLTSVAGAANAEESQEWTFVYTAFLKSSGSTTLKLEFHDGKKYVADKTLSGVDPTSTVLAGDIVISEDDGLTKGKKYTLKMVGNVRGKDVVLATSTLTMN